MEHRGTENARDYLFFYYFNISQYINVLCLWSVRIDKCSLSTWYLLISFIGNIHEQNPVR